MMYCTVRDRVMRNFFALFLLAAFFVTGCASEQYNQRAVSAPAPEGSYESGITQAMDSQELEFRQAGEKAFALSMVQRANDVLTLNFKSDLLFDKNSAVIKTGAYSSGELDRVAQILNRYPFTRIRVEVYTDSTGGESANQVLSERRANAFKNALITRNVEPSRIIAIGLGQATPIAGNDTREGRQLNRRVAVVLTPPQAWQQPPASPADAAEPQQPSQNQPPVVYGPPAAVYDVPAYYGPPAIYYGAPYGFYYPPAFYGGFYYGSYHGDGNHHGGGHHHGGHR
jgi:outer membrane protein OmpA-like peptidoglycan-associated protein